MLDEFMAQFYQAISFGPGEPFPAERFRALFRLDALLLERVAWLVAKCLRDLRGQD